MLAQAPNSRPSPPLPALPLSEVSLVPVVMADDPCEAALSGADPTGPRKYYRARYYDPKLGRFVSEDPIQWFGGDNFYSYVRDNPVNRVDPWGMYDCRYDIATHRMVCSSSQPGNNPPFTSNNAASGTGSCQNSPPCQNVRDHGPIPPGTYTVGPQLPNSSRRNLTPDPSNTMYRRYGFQTHGCGNPATCSTGCIAFTTNADRDLFNHLMDLEPNSTITVVP